MNQDKKRAPTPVSADVGAGPVKAYDDNNSIAQPGEECKPELGYFAVVPIAIMRDKRLPDSAKLLYCHISALTRAEGYCWATNAYLGEIQDISPVRVGQLLGILERLGYLVRTTIRDPETNAVQRREIRLIFDGWAGVTPPIKNNGTSHEKQCDPPMKNDKENNINRINNTPYSPPEGDKPKGQKTGSQSDQMFDLFWKAYPPRKGRKNGKKPARQVWGRLKVTTSVFADIMAGLERYISSDDVRRGYAMDASRWLRDRRWEDEEITPLNPDTPPDALLPGENAEDYLWIGD